MVFAPIVPERVSYQSRELAQADLSYQSFERESGDGWLYARPLCASI